MYVEVYGRPKKMTDKLGTKGCAYLGKLVYYQGERYEELGEAWLDIVSPHVMLILGKRGTGKSYSLGVLVESFGLLEQRYRERVCCILVDTMSVYHSLKVPNMNGFEVRRLKDFGPQWQPKGFDEMVKIFVPKLTVEKLREGKKPLNYDKLLQLPLKDVDVYDWLQIFNLKQTEPVGVLLTKVVSDLARAKIDYGWEDLYRAIEEYRVPQDTKEALKALFSMVEGLGVFVKSSGGYEDIIKGGQITVLDISFLGRVGGFDLRALIIAMIARKLLADRVLYTTVEMQSEAGLINTEISKDIAKEHPLIYMAIDEAHLFLPNEKESPKTLASDVLVDWIKLGRHPGLSLILATQEPSALHVSAIRQADLIIAHNVTAQDDVQALSRAKQTFQTARTDIAQVVSTMEFMRGLACVMDDKTRSTQLVIVRPRLSLHCGVDASAIPLDELDRFETKAESFEREKSLFGGSNVNVAAQGKAASFGLTSAARALEKNMDVSGQPGSSTGGATGTDNDRRGGGGPRIIRG